MSTFLQDLARVLPELTGGMSPCRVLLAVSGGLDSMVLLRSLSLVVPVMGWGMDVAHYNHQLRGEASDADQELVHETTRKLGLDFHCGTGDVAGRSAQAGISMEMAARELRYDFLGNVASRVGANFIVTAHHADDLVEQLWMRLLRGVEGHGLEMMKPLTRVPNLSAPLLRPLLGFTRSQLLEWGRTEQIVWREDASNEDHGIPRNWVRHRLLPILAEGASLPLPELTQRMGCFLQEQLDAVRMIALEWLNSPAAKAWENLPVAIRKEAVRIKLMEAGLQTTRAVVVALACQSDASVSVWSVGAEDGLRIVRWDAKHGVLKLLEPSARNLDYCPDSMQVALGASGETRFGGISFTWSFIPAVPGKPSEFPALFDSDTVRSPWTLRHWQPGDRFHKLGMSEASKLQDVFVNAAIPSAERRKLVLIEAADGQIIWVEQLGVCHPCRVRPETSSCLKLIWEKVPGALSKFS